MSPTGTNESGASDRTNAVSRRHVLQLFGIAGVGIAGVGSLEACSPSSPTAESSKSGGNKEFHGAYPYQLPPKGHFNLAAGVTDGIQQQSPYLDLIYPSGGLYYWADKKWEYMMAESSKLDEAANTVEFYIHAEDVRRAQPDWSQRDLDPVFADALWSRMEKAARLMGRKAPVGLVLRRPNGQTAVAHRGTPVVTVSGEPGELTMFLFGRQDTAKVDLEGEPDAIERLHQAKQLGI